MKKVLLYISIFAAGLFVAVSCDKNDPPVFDDANAFVAFDVASASIDEAIISETGEVLPQSKTLKIPVTLGSTKGITENVKFNVKDGTAKAGVNFNLKTTSGTLAFDAENRTRYVEIEALYLPDYTGDLKFTIELVPSETVALGYISTCTVIIGDVDHPLTDLIGDYKAKSGDGTNWTMTLYKDESDDHMVWFFDLFGNPGWSIMTTMFYGNVDDSLSTITIPFGQTTEYKYGGSTPVTLYWVNNADQVGKTGSLAVTIVKDGDGKIKGLDFGQEYGFYALLEGLGYVGLVYPQITAEKQ